MFLPNICTSAASSQRDTGVGGRRSRPAGYPDKRRNIWNLKLVTGAGKQAGGTTETVKMPKPSAWRAEAAEAASERAGARVGEGGRAGYSLLSRLERSGATSLQTLGAGSRIASIALT